MSKSHLRLSHPLHPPSPSSFAEASVFAIHLRQGYGEQEVTVDKQVSIVKM